MWTFALFGSVPMYDSAVPFGAACRGAQSCAVSTASHRFSWLASASMSNFLLRISPELIQQGSQHPLAIGDDLRLRGMRSAPPGGAMLTELSTSMEVGANRAGACFT